MKIFVTLTLEDNKRLLNQSTPLLPFLKMRLTGPSGPLRSEPREAANDLGCNRLYYGEALVTK